MRRLIILIAMIVSVLCSGAAFASEYVVKRGDTLSGISKIYLGNSSKYRVIAKANKIANPNLIRVGQKLNIPDMISQPGENQTKKVSVDAKEFKYKHPGRDPYVGSLEEALEILGYSDEVKAAFSVLVANDIFVSTELKHGDRIKAMTFGKKKVRVNVVAAWKNKQVTYPARLFEVEVGGVKYRLLYPLICGNWSRLEESEIPPALVEPPEILVEPPQILIEPPEVLVEPPTEIETPAPPITEEETPKEYFPEPVSEVPETKEVAEIPEAEKGCCPIEHEPIIGAGVWGSGIAEGSFEYAEYMLWLKKPIFRCDSEYSWGIGAYGSWEQGESKISSYDWKGHLLGPQAGLKYSGVYYDDQDKKYRLQQWTTKLRLGWEETSGSNSEGYKMHQDGTKLGLYSEYVRELNDKWMVMGVAEGWMGLDSSIKSSWSGDKPSERGQVMLSGYGQYQINDDWAVRFGGGPFWQQWDDMYGLHLRAEARWKNTIMFGPYANIFPFGKSATYSAISASELTVPGAFIRIELGEPIRQYDRSRRMQRVKLADEERFGMLQEENPL